MKEEDYYNLGEWAGLPNYECKQCPYSSLDKSKLLEHVSRKHSSPPEPEKVDGGVILKPPKKPEGLIVDRKPKKKASKKEVDNG